VSSVTEPSGSSEFAWKFIVSPENIDWSTSADVNRIPIFGSNQSPVVVGAKSMRDLELGNAMVEGFTRGVTVEGKVQALEDLLNYSLNTSKGFVNVPVYQITANDKQYGSGKDAYDGGYFVIKEVRVKETMRDFRGNTTRAFVDVSFTQIPPYQVDGGRDQATNTTQKAAGQLLLKNIADQVTPATASGAGAPTPTTPGAPATTDTDTVNPRRPSPAAGAKPPQQHLQPPDKGKTFIIGRKEWQRTIQGSLH
jgi:hypothetical protein